MARIFLTRTLALLLAVSGASTAQAVTVTRKAGNLYKIDGEPLWLRTQYCHEYAYGEEASLVGREIIFKQRQSKCDIIELLKDAYIRTGRRHVTLIPMDSDLYYIGDGVYLQTRSCFESKPNEQAILDSVSSGHGTLMFEDTGKRCTVDNLLSEADLP